MFVIFLWNEVFNITFLIDIKWIFNFVLNIFYPNTCILFVPNDFHDIVLMEPTFDR